MGHAELIKAVVAATGQGQNIADQVLRAAFEAIEAQLDMGNKVKLLGIGTLCAKATKARTARNPKSGDSIAVEPGIKVKFTATASLKARLNRR